MSDKNKSLSRNALWPQDERLHEETKPNNQNQYDMETKFNYTITPTDEVVCGPRAYFSCESLFSHLNMEFAFEKLLSSLTATMQQVQFHYVPEENPWADFGRAYFRPYQFDLEHFKVNILTMDELRRQIEAYESSMSCLPSFAVIDGCNPVGVECRAVEEECLLVGDSCISLQCLKGMALETSYYDNVIDNWNDGWRASIPYIKYPSLHCLALNGEQQTPEAVAASRRRCRSFLAAQADEKPSDDLLGH